MNEVFLIGRLLEDVEYRFMIEKWKICKSCIKARIIGWNKSRNYSI